MAGVYYDFEANQEMMNDTLKSMGIENNVPSVSPSNIDYAQSQMKDELEEAYRREDEIRKHVEAREDSAYQRATRDMRSAGIDPNLVGVTPSASGGGITNASRMDMTRFTAAVDMIMQEIQNEFQMNENEKDRLHKTVSQVIDKVAPTKYEKI